MSDDGSQIVSRYDFHVPMQSGITMVISWNVPQ